MNLKKFIFLISFVFILNSCGVITKCRYGNGYKLNIEFNRKEKIDYFVAKTAHKKEKKFSINFRRFGR